MGRLRSGETVEAEEEEEEERGVGSAEGSDEDVLVVVTRGAECLDNCLQRRSISLDLRSR